MPCHRREKFVENSALYMIRSYRKNNKACLKTLKIHRLQFSVKDITRLASYVSELGAQACFGLLFVHGCFVSDNVITISQQLGLPAVWFCSGNRNYLTVGTEKVNIE